VLRFGGEQEYSLIFEMFAEGNLLLVGGDGKIQRCARREEWKDRGLREGQEYKFPGSDRLSPPFYEKQIKEILESKTMMAVLSSKTNFGNQYLEEALARAKIDPKYDASKLKESEVAFIAKELNKIFEESTPILYKKDGKAFDYSLTLLSKHSQMECVGKKTLSEAVDECANADAGEKRTDEGLEQDKRREKLKLRLKKQKEHSDRILKEAEECKKKGDDIYARYQETELVLKTIREMKRSGKSWGEIKKALEGKCEIDEHSGVVTLP
jgi:predicted ribosome quality control (RQC) complex YloA/Tae2 family protein